MSAPPNPWGAQPAAAYPQQQQAWQQPQQQQPTPQLQQPAADPSQYQQQQPGQPGQPLGYGQYAPTSGAEVQGQPGNPSPWGPAGTAGVQYQQAPQGQVAQPQQQQQFMQPQGQSVQAQQQYATYVSQAGGQGAAAPWAAGASNVTAVPAAAPAGIQPQALLQPMESANRKVWVGTVTQLIPPNYGIVDGEGFYVTAVVQGRVPQLGERVRCDATLNTDGGQYKWRCNTVAVDSQQAVSVGGMLTAAYAATQAKPAAAAAARPGGLGARGNRFSLSKLGGVPDDTPKPRFNSAPPPAVQYMADAALAVAAVSVETPVMAAPTFERERERDPSVIASKAAQVYNRPVVPLSEEEKKRSEEAVKNFVGDPSGIGAKLLSKMGFGATEGSKGGLGRNEQGISAPVDPASTKGNRGLGFAFGGPARGDRGDRDRGGGGGGRQNDRDRDRERGHRRSRSRSRSRSKSRSRSRSTSSSRSRSRSRSPTGRYQCKTPKFWVYERLRGLASISKRYKDLYIPSDFCHLDASWVETVPDHNPVDIACPFAFNIYKASSTDSPAGAPPPDQPPAETKEGGTTAAAAAAKADASAIVAAAAPAADVAGSSLTDAEKASGRRWSAKVMVFSGIASEHLGGEDTKGFQHPLRKLKFLVGQRSKNEYFTLGGSWDPSDGGHPEKDPGALIRTAIRTYKEATGVDLSACTQWTKMAQLTYMRTSSSSSSSKRETTMEHTALFVVDAWAVTKAHTSAMDALTNAKLAQGEEDCAKLAWDEAEIQAKKAEKLYTDVVAAHPASQKEPEAADDLKLDPATLTVVELQAEHVKRELDPLKDGKKALEKRLQEYLDKRRAERNVVAMGYRLTQEAKASSETAASAAVKAKAAFEAAKAAAREGRKLLKEQLLTECMEVTPGRVLMAHKATVTAKYLDQLLNYSDDDTKEGSFEVAVFAELFKEMLQVRFGRALLRALPPIISVVQAKEREEKEKEKERAKSSSSRRRSSRSERSDKDKDKDKEKDRKSDRDREKDRKSDKGRESTKDKEGVDKAKKEDEKESKIEDEKESKDKVEVKKEEAEKEKEEDVEMTEKEKREDEEDEKAEAEEKEAEATAMATDDVDGRKRAAEAPEGEDTKRSKTEHAPDPTPTPAPAPSGVSEPMMLVGRFFDQNCAGYLDADDLEELFYMVAPDVSRRHVQALVDAVCNKRSKLSYIDYSSVRIPPPQRAASALSKVPSLAVGGQLPVGSSECSFVTVDGVLVDVASLRSKLVSSEGERREAETRARVSETSVTGLKASESRLSGQVNTLTEELKELRNKMAVFSSGQSNLQAVFFATLADMELAQQQMSSAMSHIQLLATGATHPDAAAAVAAAAAAVDAEKAAAAAAEAAANAPEEPRAPAPISGFVSAGVVGGDPPPAAAAAAAAVPPAAT